MNGEQNGAAQSCLGKHQLKSRIASSSEGMSRVVTFSSELNVSSFEGIWEGFFTYTEFTAYAAMLRGAAPQVIQKSIVGSHQQTWKLREWHLVEGVADSDDLYRGDPLRSYFPIGARISETSDGLTLTLPGRALPIAYQRAGTRPGKVVDVIITGEGHSAWGQFNLTGRVRPCDGFISLSKDYVRPCAVSDSPLSMQG